MIPTPEEAYRLLQEYNAGDFHLKHGRIVGDCMRWFAEQLGHGDEKDFWETVGILHDLDFEQFPDQHCIKSQEIMREKGIDERIIRATACHGYGITVDIVPQHDMEKVLYAVDELTGLIGAAVLMRPSKSVMDLPLKSLKKKFKDKRFAAGCDRDYIRKGAELNGLELDEMMGSVLEAMKAIAPVGDIYVKDEADGE